MLRLYFEGWFQCRLATDPDPTDEPRGASGFTFAVAGEPDFDRVIRFHDPVAPRSYGPEVGVFVRRVVQGSATADSNHPLVGARIHLDGEPKFEARNYVLRDSSQGPIVPFQLRISEVDGEDPGISIVREDHLYPPKPELPLHKIPLRNLMRRGSWIPLTIDPVRIAQATGILDPVALRAERKALLERDLQHTEDPVEQAALRQRIDQLGLNGPNKQQLNAMTYYNDTRFEMNGPSEVIDPEGRLGVVPDGELNWPIAFWMGAWDSDALCGFVSGILTIPIREPQDQS